ncbi:MAG TPA: hypothetical protein VFJ22_12835, partial [Dermatophilaceae bacterium]|nr:hypothetical protein [Dermatophilaceae bacterium]
GVPGRPCHRGWQGDRQQHVCRGADPAFAFVMAVVRREDKRVSVALLVIGMLSMVFLTLFTGASGGVETTGG